MLDNKQLFSKCLCNWLERINNENLITEEEYHKIDEYIMDNLLMVEESNFIDPHNKNISYVWEIGDIKPRISWLEHHISIN